MRSTETLMLKIYEQAFSKFNLGAAYALSSVVVVILFIFTMLYYKLEVEEDWYDFKKKNIQSYKNVFLLCVCFYIYQSYIYYAKYLFEKIWRYNKNGHLHGLRLHLNGWIIRQF